MELIRKYGYIVLTIIIVTLLVVLRSAGTGHFRYDAKKWAGPSFSGSNIITQANISSLKGNKLLIMLGAGQQGIGGIDCKVISIPPDSILSKKHVSLIRGNKGAVILYSKDYSLSSKVWMVLSQSGFRNIYIYSTDPDYEVLKK
jgi:hypothetical protein